MKSILLLVGLLSFVVNVVGTFIHVATIYYSYSEVSSWWGVFFTVIGLTFADLYWAYQWWGSGFAIFVVVVSILLLILNGLQGGLNAAAPGDVD